jgi:hypothetical protein
MNVDDHRTPRWVVLLTVGFVVVVLIVVAMMVFGGVEHGPGRHG